MENPTPEPSLDPSIPTPPPAESPCPAAEPALESAVAPGPQDPAEIPAAPAPEASAEVDPLLALAQAAKAARLNAADEERAVSLLKERLTSGRAGIKSAVAPITEGLPWVVCVNALSAVWEELSPVMRRFVLSSIAKVETEPVRRLRLSLARGLFKIDPAAGAKLAAAASSSLKGPETGALSNKHRQYFFNIFIGKGKPWLTQLPLADLKPAEAEALVHAAVESFSFCPPFSQLSVLRWIHDAGRFKKISATDLASVAKSLGRWNTKYQRQLKAEVPELPPELEAALKPEARQPAPERVSTAQQENAPAEGDAEPSPEPTPETPAEQAEPASAPEEQEPAGEPVPAEAAQAQLEQTEQPEELIIPGRAERLAHGDRNKERRREKQGRNKPEPGEMRRQEKGRAFDVKEALRGVESYVAGLRSELESAKAQLQRQESRRPLRAQRPEEILPAEEVEALKRHNARLEATVTELRSALEDLARNDEAVAESRQMYAGEPLADGGAEALKALLAIKLQEAFETYHVMRLEPLDKVFRLDYRDLLGSVFDVLMEQGVALKKQAPKP